MSYRFMRILVLFDLPTETSLDLREYRRFRMILLEMGFIMLQESVYTKIALTTTISEQITNRLRHEKPANGLVQILRVTEKQFENMETLVGEYNSNVIDTDEKVVIL
ncbi:MAG: CRISPR-associated endonuclease Cas2 [Negativicoccus succinicivorans]|nr:CRISPR-associated endonuclease Cas2 [Negativicoccus succinicivorans]